MKRAAEKMTHQYGYGVPSYAKADKIEDVINYMQSHFGDVSIATPEDHPPAFLITSELKRDNFGVLRKFSLEKPRLVTHRPKDGKLCWVRIFPTDGCSECQIRSTVRDLRKTP